MRGTAPLWLSQPSRFAGLMPRRARIAAALAALLVALSFLALASPGPPPVSRDPAARADNNADIVLYSGIVEAVRHGGDYYQVTAAALRAGDYPLRPFVTFRLPTLARAEALLPDWGIAALLWLLAAGVVFAWGKRLLPAFTRGPPRIIALALLAGGMVVFVQPELIWFHEIWAGLLVALSLALRRPGYWVEAAAIACAAMLIRETAALYAAIMAAMAWRDGDRREAAGWAAALGVLALCVAFHARAVAAVTGPLDPASPGWAGMLGYGFFVKTMTISTALSLFPAWIAAPLVSLALIGWAAWRSALATRALATFVGYAALLALFGRTDTFYWGLMIAPTLLVGLAFAPDGLRDLWRRAGEHRRIVVRRAVR